MTYASSDRQPQTNRTADYRDQEDNFHHRTNPFRSFGVMLAVSGAVWLGVTFGVWWVL